jgi:hypothetical protein
VGRLGPGDGHAAGEPSSGPVPASWRRRPAVPVVRGRSAYPAVRARVVTASLVMLATVTGCQMAGGIGERHMPDANRNDGESYTICLHLTAPGGDASRAFTDADIVLNGVRAPMTRAVATPDKVEFVYSARTAELLGKIPSYHFEYSAGWRRRNVHRPAQSVSKPVTATPDTLYDSIDQIGLDPPIVRAQMGQAHTHRQFEATLYDGDGNEVGTLRPYHICGGGWYVAYRDEARRTTVYKRRGP